MRFVRNSKDGDEFMKTKKRALAYSVISLLLCISMLLGTTFAWFTDDVTSGVNRIIAGNLDVDVFWAEDYNGPWYELNDPDHSTVFDYELWEPGYTQVRYVKIVNKGTLALKYKLNIEPAGPIGEIAQVLDVTYMSGVTAAQAAAMDERAEFDALTKIGVLNEVITGLHTTTPAEGVILPEGETPWYEDIYAGETICMMGLHMQEDAGNEYQGSSIGEGFYITAVATQYSFEDDSFGSDYDEDIVFPEVTLPQTITTAITLDDSNAVEADTNLDNGSGITALVQAGTKFEDGTTEAVLSVALVSQSGNIYAGDDTISRTLDVHVAGVSDSNTTPIIITIENALPINMNLGAITLYHTENNVQNLMSRKNSLGDVAAHNDYYYNSTNGSVTMALQSFSEILFEVDTRNTYTGAGMGSGTKLAVYDYSGADTGWYDGHESESTYTISTASQLEGLAKLVNAGNTTFEGKTIKLGADIVINDWDLTKADLTGMTYSENKDYCALDFADSSTNDPAFENNGTNFKYFPTIGSYEDKNYRPFCGTFDGQNHTISGMFNLYYDDPMESRNIGLFGMVEGATIKNLTVSDCFYYTYGGMIGMVATRAYGNCTFDNIRVTENFATQYNYYLGGIVGYVYSGGNTHVTFNECYVDNTNLFEALWGTYDAAIGGLVGAVGAKNYDTAPTITIKNCCVFPTVSLYNDCCANYQWFAYRYSGMLIGYVNAPDRAQYLANKVICTDTTVKYGSWTDQYYCELISNGHPSYCGPHDWKYSRVDISELTFNKTTKKYECNHNHSTAGGRDGQTFTFKGIDYTYDATDENNSCVNIRFNQLFGGGQGVYGEDNETYLTYCKQYGKNSTGVTIEDNGESGAILSTKFVNNDKYLYRIGNKNSVTIGTIFSAEGITDDESVQLLRETVSGTATVTYTPNSSNWENGTLTFSGTGLIKLTFKYLGSTPVELYIEVIDAKNLTTITNISEYDAVLVNDCSMGETTYTISNGHTLYGNGFTISSMNVGLGLGGDLMGNGYIELKNGNLENIQIVCAIYPRGYLYINSKSYGEAVKDANNKNPLRSEAGRDRYNYQYSAVAISGKSMISNCYIEGARNNILVNSTDGCVISNTTLAYGSLANIHVNTNSGSITLKNLTTIQDVVSTNLPSTVLADGNHNADSSKTVFGLGILIGDNDTSSYPTIKIEGTLKQNNWIKQGTTVSSSVSNMIINAVFNGNSDYQKTINGQKYVNIGIVYMSTKTANIDTDNMTNYADYKCDKVSIPGIGTGQTYSYIGSADSSSLTIPNYEYEANDSDRRIDEVKLCYIGKEDYEVNDVYDSALQALIPTVRTEIGEGESRQLAVKDIVAKRAGVNYKATTYTVNGSNVSEDYVINCNSSEQFTIGLSGTANGYYDKNGQYVEDPIIFNLSFRFFVISTAIDGPTLIFGQNYDSDNNKFNKTGKTTSWTGVWKVLNDVEVRYYSKSRNCYVQVPLGVFTPSTNGQLGQDNVAWSGTYDGCTLTVSSTAKIHSGQSQYGKFYVFEGEMYLTNDKEVSSETRSATIKYTIVDSNSKTETISKTRVVSSSATKKNPTQSSSNYYLRLDPGAGTVSQNAYGPNSKNTTIELPTPTLKGYAFDGWFDKPVGGNKQSTSYKTTANNVVLYAHWHELVNCTIILDPDGGYCDEKGFEGYAGTSYVLPSATKDGYYLVGWYNGDTRVGGAGDSYTVPESNVTLTAHWAPKYTVTYNANGGTVDLDSATYEGTALTLPTPTNGSKTFEGWYTAAEGGTKIGTSGDSYTPMANIELFAQWSDNILVTFDGNGGTAGTNSATYDHVTPITLPAATRAGHAFNGWYTATSGGTKVGNAGATYTPTEATTLHAQWTAYAVTYDANGGSVSPSSASGVVTLPTPTRTGYTFNGWYTETSGGTKIGSGGASYTPTADITLHAQWTVNSYKVTITTSNSSTAVTVVGTTVNNGGSVAYNSVVKVVLSYSQSKSLTFTIKQGNNSVTYYTDEACTKSSNSTAAGTYYFKMPAGDVTINSSSAAGSSSCVTSGSLITLADGTQKAVEDLIGNEILLVWNLETGTFDTAPIMFVDSDPEADYEVICLYFSDGTNVDVISEHGFWDYDRNEYVYLDSGAASYIGHTFAKQDGDSLAKVKLVDVVIETERTTAWSPVTFGHLNYFVNGMLSMPGGIQGLFNIFEVDPETMTYNAEKMQGDIDAYGLLTLEDYGGMITEDMFYAFNGQYLGVAVGKGMITWEDIAYLAERYAPLCE